MNEVQNKLELYNQTSIALSRSDPYCPKPIEKQSVCIDGDFMETLKELQGELG